MMPTAATASISSVRTAGTCAPASSTYPSANTMPTPAATRRAGTRVVSATLRRASASARPPAIDAKTVTCSPEMLIRCPMPVRLKTRHCDSGIARCSPIVSATITPAYGASGKRSEDARAHALARSLDVVRCAPGERIEQRVALAASDVAGGAQAALEHPRLDVEPVRVDRAVRTLESNDEAPALARQRCRGPRRSCRLCEPAHTRRATGAPERLRAAFRRARRRGRSACRAPSSAGGRRRRRRARYRRPPTRRAARRRAERPRANPRSRSPAHRRRSLQGPSTAMRATSDSPANRCNAIASVDATTAPHSHAEADGSSGCHCSSTTPAANAASTSGSTGGRAGTGACMKAPARCRTPHLSRESVGQGGCVEQRRAGNVKLPLGDRPRHSSNSLAAVATADVSPPSARASSACSGRARSACRRRAG